MGNSGIMIHYFLMIYMNVKPSNNLYNVYIDVNGYLTDENVWP